MAKPRKKIGALLKLLGTATLLVSFGAQNFFYDISNTRSIQLIAAMRDMQMIDKSALLQEVRQTSLPLIEASLVR